MVFGIYLFLGILCLASGFYGAEAFKDYCNDEDLDYWATFKLFDFVKEIDYTYLELNQQLMCTDLCPCQKIEKPLEYKDYTFVGKDFTGSNLNVN